MTIERTLIAVLFLMHVRNAIAIAETKQKHNGLVEGFNALTRTIADFMDTDEFTAKLDKNLKRLSRIYREHYGEDEDDDKDD